MKATLEQLTHKHTFTVSRTIHKDEMNTVADATRQDLALTLSQFIAKKLSRTAVDGEAVQISLRLIVLTPEEFQAIVEGLDDTKPQQGDLYVGHDAQAG